MSFSMADLRAALSESTRRDVSDQEAALAYVQLDQAALRREQERRVRWDRWNGRDPINGASPEYIRSRMDYGGGEIYLVYIDGELVFLQPHAPEATDNGPIERRDLVDVAEAHVATIVDELTFQAAVEESVRLLPPSAPPAQPMMVTPSTPLVERQGPPGRA